ncbi:MAG: phage holin family protein [Eggerthellaceae bacterium]|nr:phage holin family protein [Eggerthellaceae bacterium]
MEGISWQPIVLAVVMMLLDIISGFAGAAKMKEIASGKMREGLWHKAGFCGLILVAAVYEVGAVWLDFEVQQLGLGVAVPDLPAVGVVCLYVVATELVSICENLIVLNPGIANAPFLRKLKPHDPDAADLTVEVDDAVKVGGSE